MGRALSSWERSERRSERDAERRASASARRAERVSAMADRARERAIQRDERNQEKAKKEQTKQESVEAARRAAETSQAYLKGLVELHQSAWTLATADAEWKARLRQRYPVGNTFKPSTFEGQFTPLTFAEMKLQQESFREPSWMFVIAFSIIGGVVGITGGAAARITDGTATYVGVMGGIVLGAVIRLIVKSKARRKFDDAAALAARAHEASETRRREEFNAGEARKQAEFNARVEAFTRSEEERKRAFDQFEEEALTNAYAADKERIECLTAARAGDLGAQSRVLEAALPCEFSLTAPDGFVGASISDGEVAYRAAGSHVELVVLAPDLDIVPDRQIELNASGERTKFKVINEKDRLSIYNKLIASQSLANAIRVFAALPHLESVLVEGCAMVLDGSVGRPTERVALRARYTRERVAEINLESVDAVEVLRRFEHEVAPIGGRNSLEPRIDRNAIFCASGTNDEVQYGLVPEQTEARLPPNPHAVRS